MKYLSWFVINPEEPKPIYEFDEIAFQWELDITNGVWYELNQVFVNWKIINYTSAAIKYSDKDKEFALAKINYIKWLYWIEPNICITDGKEFYLVFFYSKLQNITEHNRIKWILSFLYDWETKDYFLYKYWKNIFNIYSSRNKSTSPRKILKYYSITKDHTYSFDTEDLSKYLEVNKLDITKVVEKAQEFNVDGLQKDLLQIDNAHNLHIILWRPFEYIYKLYWSPISTKKFFNEHFWIDFNLEEDSSVNAINWWTLIENVSGDIYLNEKWYAKNTTNDIKQLTDFHIEVNYIIHDLNWTKTYIVTLINTFKGIRTPKIKLETKVNAASFAEFVQAYGNFHFHWTTTDIKEIHTSIASIPWIPEIKQLVWFGEHLDEKIIVFKNWIWSLEEGMFYDREEDSEFFDWPENTWYYIVDSLWKGLLHSLDKNIPIFNKEEKIDKEVIYDVFESLYADNTWYSLLYSLFWVLWHLLYWEKESTFPLLFTRWVTGAWKSKMNSIMQESFWLKNSSNDFWNTSLFSFNYALSYLIKFPYFITEYREWADNRKSKVGTLRAIFDKTGQTKWRADQSVVKYEYFWVPILDWEEMIIDWALRTRSIQTQLIRKHLIKWNFEAILKKNSYVFKNIMYTYFLTSNWQDYNNYMNDFVELALKENWAIDSRIAKNIAQMYAGAMCFDKSLEEQLKIVLSEVALFQSNDKEQNSTSMQIIKVIVKFLESNPFDWVFPRKDKVIISRNAITNFINRFKIETTLNSSSYEEHLEWLWYKVDYEDVWDKIVHWLIIPYSKMKKYFLTHPEVYASYKDWKKEHDV